ncbi:cell filamentation protein [Micrococcus cohnii]|uniref:protein adenylyltransferase n=1 Tax=Micrococcus cohnii TaxID=993416 RepID=A0A7W7M286_9MICC|nr:Fic family protein [Micrococcus cohnii]MBB4734719.1 cell filamentation protein [Micrococcus cohnii]
MDPYVEPETGVLRNKLGITDKVALADAEGDLSSWRALQLAERKWPVSGDLDELRRIHGYLFQDVYTWAGQVRTVDMRKNVDGAAAFLPCAVIPTATSFLAQRLREDDHLRRRDRAGFVDGLTDYYEELNYIHPFREGNGRTQRLFWSRVAYDAGWVIEWRAAVGAENDHACRLANDEGDKRPLRQMMQRIIYPRQTERTGDAADAEWHHIIGMGFDFAPDTTGPDLN